MQLSKITTLLSASLLLLTALSTNVVTAHEIASNSVDPTSRAVTTAEAKTSLEACQNADHVRALQSRLAQRRLAKVAELRRRRRLDAVEVSATSHKFNASQFDAEDPEKVFGSTPKCALHPEVTEGPYYVKGELLRSDIRESQRGVDLHTEIQVIDTTTCKPVDNLYLDFWHCNATGVYSGVVAKGNGDANDLSNLNATFARGVYATNADGIVTFTTKFPGHYAGRATHIHVVASTNGTVLPNNTYAGASSIHVGQLFFDMDLVEAVEATEPYASNDAVLTKNCVDGIFQQSTDGGFDPVLNYVYLGETVEDGIFSWITIGVNTNAQAKGLGAAATLTASGGVASAADTTRRGPMDGSVPKAPGPKADDNDARNATTTQTNVGADDKLKARSGVFSFLFFVASASALAAFLYKFPTKKEPRRMYAPMASA